MFEIPDSSGCVGVGVGVPGELGEELGERKKEGASVYIVEDSRFLHFPSPVELEGESQVEDPPSWIGRSCD